MRLLTALYAAYAPLVFLALFVLDRFGEADCWIMCESTTQTYNWADYVGLIGFVLLFLFSHVTQLFVLAFVVGAFVAIRRRGLGAVPELLLLAAVAALGAAPGWWMHGSF